MAKALLAKSRKMLESKTKTIARLNKKSKESQQVAYLEGAAGSVAGTVGAAAIDAKMGDGGTATFGESDIPVNAAGYAVALGMAFMPKMPFRYFVGFGGLAAGNTALYNTVKEKLAE